MPSLLAPVCLIALVASAPDHAALVSVRRLSAPADVAIVTAAVREGSAAELPTRDALAYRLLALGYNARETADIVTGRTTKADVDRAHARRLAGYREPAPVIHPLTMGTGVPGAHVARVTIAVPPARVRPVVQAPVRAVATPPAAPSRVRTPVRAQPVPSRIETSVIDAAIDRYARLHAVDPALVRAIIGEESGFRHAARSPVGAIGLMQLMPGTARRLGVNPYVAEQNIEGGIRYLAEQLRAFGRIELALVAYNAGPVFAERYARGETGLYNETRG
jgi:hypothetical protein